MEDYYESTEEPRGETDDIIQKEFDLETEGVEEPRGEREDILEKGLNLEMESSEEPRGETDDIIQKEFDLETEGYEEPRGETEEFDLETEGYGETSVSVDSFAQRLLELQEGQFESQSSKNAAIEGVMTEIEKDFFIKKLAGGAIGGILKKLLGGLGAGLNPLNFIKSAIALVRLAAKEPLRGTLINVVTTHPSFAPARPLLKLLGIAETGEYTGDSLESWKEFVRLSEYMYEDIINNMTEAAIKDPVAS